MSLTVITDPSRTVGENDVHELLISKWVAVHNAIIYSLQRKDDTIDNLLINTGEELNGYVTLDTAFASTKFNEIVVGDFVYVNCDPVIGLFEVLSITAMDKLIVVKLPAGYTAGTYTPSERFANLTSLVGYYADVQIGTVTDGTYAIIANTQFTPFTDGTLRIDPAAWLQKIAPIQDSFNYSDAFLRDLNLANGFKMKYRERYKAEGSVPSYADPGTFFYVNAAKQIRDKFGQNMGEYVTFESDPDPLISKAKFLTLFSLPVYFPGFPFEIACIISEQLVGLTLDYVVVSFNASGVAFVLAITTPITNAVGVNRLNIKPQAGAFSMSVKIKDHGSADIFTETKMISVYQGCADFPVYLKWLNTLGGWSYWMFVFNQQKTLQVTDAVTYEQVQADLELADGKLEYLSKRAFPKMIIGATDVSAANLAGLKGLMYSPKVQVLLNPTTWLTDGPVVDDDPTSLAIWQTVGVQPGTFALEPTRLGFADVELVIEFPEINIQTQ